MNHLDFIEEVAKKDVAAIRKAEEQYGGSWKKRGGIGAFMMLARKWDRIERQITRSIGTAEVRPYDIFGHIIHDSREEGIIDDVRDLRRYLMLVEAEIMARK